ncbi:MAG: dephospho-CoA kinase [Deltaproteobacteria bacterium]|nr:dephospho-CoA kinase [Deltaproteobacteria bacterium]
MLIGLTGGIASGKSLVADEMKRLGAFVVDADVIARRVIERGAPAYQEITKEFGSAILNADGSVNRGGLAKIIFHDAARRAVLNKIMHPRIREGIWKEVEDIRKRNKDAVIVVDAALLFENKLDREMDTVVVVLVDDDKMVERMVKRNGVSEAEARERLKAQMPAVEKALKADYIIDNNNKPEDTLNLVRLVYEEIMRGVGK